MHEILLFSSNCDFDYKAILFGSVSFRLCMCVCVCVCENWKGYVVKHNYAN